MQVGTDRQSEQANGGLCPIVGNCFPTPSATEPPGTDSVCWAPDSQAAKTQDCSLEQALGEVRTNYVVGK
jgi:hypothetical protein